MYMQNIILQLKSRIENNLGEVESYYDSIHIFLAQAKIVNDNNLQNFKIKQWLDNNKYTIIILEEILEKIERKKELSA